MAPAVLKREHQKDVDIVRLQIKTFWKTTNDQSTEPTDTTIMSCINLAKRRI